MNPTKKQALFAGLLSILAYCSPAVAENYKYIAVDTNDVHVFDINLTTDSGNFVTAISGEVYGYNITGLVNPGMSFNTPDQLYPYGAGNSPNLVDSDGITWYIDFFPGRSPWNNDYDSAIFRWKYNPFDGDTMIGTYWGGAPQAYGLKITGGALPVPEPASYALMLMGVLGVAARVRQNG